MVGASVQMHGTTFVDFDICHRMVSLRRFNTVTLADFLNINKFQTLTSEIVRSSVKMHAAFVYFDICHRMTSFLNLSQQP